MNNPDAVIEGMSVKFQDLKRLLNLQPITYDKRTNIFIILSGFFIATVVWQ
jgi:hypothetical protein